MHDGDVIGVEPPPCRQMVEQEGGGALRRDQCPCDAVPVEQLGQLIAVKQHRLNIALDEFVAVKLGPPVDKGRDADENQVAAKTVIVEDRAGHVSRLHRGERGRRHCDVRAGRGAVQHRGAERRQYGSGKRGATKGRRLCQLRQGTVDRAGRAAGCQCPQLRGERRGEQQRGDKANQLAVAAMLQRHVQQPQQHEQPGRRQPPAQRETGEQDDGEPKFEWLEELEIGAAPFDQLPHCKAHSGEAERQ